MAKNPKRAEEARQRYKAAHYAKIGFTTIPKEIVDAFKKKCAENGVTATSVVRRAMEDYIKNG